MGITISRNVLYFAFVEKYENLEYTRMRRVQFELIHRDICVKTQYERARRIKNVILLCANVR